ncbi:hypothetical protein VrSk94_21620 [Vibrio rotiferianus]
MYIQDLKIGKKITQISFIMPQLSVYFNHEIKMRLEEGGYMSAQANIEPLNAKLIDSKSTNFVIFQSKHFKDDDNGVGFVSTSALDINFTYETHVSIEEISKLMFKVANLFTWLFGTPSYATSSLVSEQGQSSYYICYIDLGVPH